MESRLIIMNGPTENMSVSLQEEDGMILGRHPKCGLRFLDDSVSGCHCRVFAEGGSFYIEDLGSTNGTYLNDQKIDTPCKLKTCDVIMIGDTKLCFVQQDPVDGKLPPMAVTTIMEAPAPPASTEEENKIGDYVILEKIGVGATGEIFKCRHVIDQRIVAVKMLHSHCLDEVSMQRFLREVNTCMRFDHPSIVKVFEFGMYQDRPILVMEYCEGKSLEEYIKANGPMNTQRALKIGILATQALRYAHKMGVVHRDLNPSNILIDEKQEIKLIDFGIAKAYGKSITMNAQTLGTVRYIPPEQIDNAKSVDHRADIYALGATLYHLLYGKPPFFDAQGLNALILRITESAATPLHKLMKIPRSVSAIVEKAMAPKKENRFQTAFEFFQALVTELKI